jgi:hypothetical protein
MRKKWVVLVLTDCIFVAERAVVATYQPGTSLKLSIHVPRRQVLNIAELIF